MDILLPSHAFSSLIGVLQPRHRRTVHLLLVLFLIVLSFRDLLAKETLHLPRQRDARTLIGRGLLGGVWVCRVGRVGDRRVVQADVLVGAFFVRVFGGLAHVFPGEEGFEAGDFGAVVADLEEEVVHADGAGPAALGEGGGAFELGLGLVDDESGKGGLVR